MSVETTATKQHDRWHLVGEKKFVTLATCADFAVVLARIDGHGRGRLGAFVVPRDGYVVLETHELVGNRSLDTSWIRIDAEVPETSLLGRPGLGLAVVSWGLTNERLAIASTVLGGCRLALTMAVTHAHERRQFGQPLIDHQVIRLRLAELQAQWSALWSQAQALAAAPSPCAREVAGLKVLAARFGERCASECMHVFGGDGYVDDVSPMGRLWRDLRLARLGAGSDEMMLEMVAGGLTPDVDTYRQHYRRARMPAAP